MRPSPTTVSLLLTNLHLLDYNNDSEESFPITTDIFTSLKNKGRAFEHIVYHLLHTFDPEECAIRLETCWPIYEPPQSRELRNVVFKWLTDLKKSGQLGGGILVRRTLLDDCFGDRYEELLLSLSTMVLRDQIEKRSFGDVNQKTFAYKQTCSLAPSLKGLTVLILAYQSSLTRLLLSRRLSKSQWSSFSSFLDTKELQISTLSETLSQLVPKEAPKILPRGYEEEVFRKWINNWLGDQRWLDILLKGDQRYMRDQFFELPFEKALAKHRHFENGLVGIRSGEVSLGALEKQVQEQKNRLRELRHMREAALRDASNLGAMTSRKAEVEGEVRAEKTELKVVFDQHQHLHSSQLKIVNDRIATQRNEYTELMDSLREDLAATGAPRRREVSITSEYQLQLPLSQPPMANLESEFMGRFMKIDPMDIDPIDTDPMDVDLMEMSDERQEPKPPIYESSKHDYRSGWGGESFSRLQRQCNPLDTPLIKVSQQIEEYEPHPISVSDASYPDDDADQGFGAFEDSIAVPNPPTSHADAVSPQPPQQNKSLRTWLGFGDDELLAEQIVLTMVATTFSPEKPSPVKRSQHRMSYQPPLDNTFDMDESTLGLSAYLPQSTRHQKNEQLPLFFAPRENLLTPSRNSLLDKTRKEDLLLSSDYNSVFKSRPKIAVSPPFTPLGGSPSIPSNLSLAQEMSETPEGIFSKEDMEDFAVEHIPQQLINKIGRNE